MDGQRKPPAPYTVYRSEADGGTPQQEGRLLTNAERAARRAEARDRRRARRRRLTASLAASLLVAVAVLAGLVLSALGVLGDRPAEAEPTASGSAASPAALLPSSGSSPAPSPSPSPSATPAPPTVTVTGGGDVIGGFSVEPVLEREGAELLAGVAPLFQKSDFGFVNLESPLTAGGDPQSWKDVVIKGDPALAEAMAASGINVVTMANNHAGDQGDSGLLDSIRLCKKQGIAVVGAGKDLETAMAGRVLTTDDGDEVAFLGYTDVLPVGYPATPTSAGIAPGRADLGAVKDAIRRADRRSDFVVVGWHWNFEYKRAPSSLEESEGKAAVDAGADLVLAHHPHLLDGVQAYHGGLIVYSLGNLVFSGFSGETAETILIRTRLSPRRLQATLVPVLISNAGVPSRARGADAERILQRVKGFSADLGTKVTIRDEKGYVYVTR
jgi:poly-gamma-glutamate synthesis protein (capsule biosynthesis protein)